MAFRRATTLQLAVVACMAVIFLLVNFSSVTSLGRTHGSIQPVHSDDTGRRLYPKGQNPDPVSDSLVQPGAHTGSRLINQSGNDLPASMKPRGVRTVRSGATGAATGAGAGLVGTGHNQVGVGPGNRQTGPAAAFQPHGMQQAPKNPPPSMFGRVGRPAPSNSPAPALPPGVRATNRGPLNPAHPQSGTFSAGAPPLSEQVPSPFAHEESMAAVEWPMLDHLLSAVTQGALVDGKPGALNPTSGTASDTKAGPVTQSTLRSSYDEDKFATKFAERIGTEFPSSGSGDTCTWPEPGKHQGKHLLPFFLDAESTPADVKSAAFPSLISKDLRDHSVLVIDGASGHLSVRLARQYPNTTVVTFSTPCDGSDLDEAGSALTTVDRHLALKSLLRVPNNPLCHTTVDDNLVSHMLDAGSRFRLIVIPDLRPLVHDALPHEFEAFLGSVLQLAPFVVLADPLPDTRYFSYWDSPSSLLKASAAAVQISAKLRSVGGTSSSSPSFNSYSTATNTKSSNFVLATVTSQADAAQEVAVLAQLDKIAKKLNKAEDTAHKKAMAKHEKATAKSDTVSTFGVDVKSDAPAPSSAPVAAHLETWLPTAPSEGEPAPAPVCPGPFPGSAVPSRVSLASLLEYGLVQDDAEAAFTLMLRSPGIPLHVLSDEVFWSGSELTFIDPFVSEVSESPEGDDVKTEEAAADEGALGTADEYDEVVTPAVKPAKGATTSKLSGTATQATRTDGLGGVVGGMPQKPPKAFANPSAASPVLSKSGPLSGSGVAGTPPKAFAPVAAPSIQNETPTAPASKSNNNKPSVWNVVEEAAAAPPVDLHANDPAGVTEPTFPSKPSQSTGTPVVPPGTATAGVGTGVGAGVGAGVGVGALAPAAAAPALAPAAPAPAAPAPAALVPPAPGSPPVYPTLDDDDGGAEMEDPDTANNFRMPDEDATAPPAPPPPTAPQDPPKRNKFKFPERLHAKPNTPAAKPDKGLRGGAGGRRLLGLITSDEDVEEHAAVARAAAVAGSSSSAPALLKRRFEPKSSAGRRSTRWAADLGPSQLKLVKSEAGNFQAWWPRLKDEVLGRQGSDRLIQHGADAPSILVSGSQTTLLSVKLAHILPSSTVVSVKHTAAEVDHHLQLLGLLRVRNNLVTRSELTSARASALTALDDPFRFQFIGVDVFQGLLLNSDSLDEFEAHLGRLLRMASTTFLELPDWNRLLHAIRVLGGASVRRGRTPHQQTRRAEDPATDAGAVDDDPLATLEDIVLGEDAPVHPAKKPTSTVGGTAGGAGGGTPDVLAALVERYDPQSSASVQEVLADDPMPPPPSCMPGQPDCEEQGDRLRLLESRPFKFLLDAAVSSAGVPRGSASVRFLRQPSAPTAPATGDADAAGAGDTQGNAALKTHVDEFAAGMFQQSGSSDKSKTTKEKPSQTPTAASTTTTTKPSSTSTSTPTPTSAGGVARTRLVRIDFGAWARLPAKGRPSASAPNPQPVAEGATSVTAAPRQGVSLHTLLSLGVLPSMRAELFQLYMSLPLADITKAAVLKGYAVETGGGASARSRPPFSLAPWTVRYLHDPIRRGGHLVVSVGPPGARDASQFTLFSTDDVLRAARKASTAAPPPSLRTQAVFSQLSPADTASGGGPGMFSLLEYNSGAGELSVAMASKFPHATLVSVEQDEDLSAVHFERLLASNLTNNYICNTLPSASLLHKLYKSPEFFRFQVLNGEFVHLLRQHGKVDFGKMLGEMFGVSVTSLVNVPPAGLLSLAFTTMFYSYPDTQWYASPAEASAVGGARTSVGTDTTSGSVELGDHALFTGLGGDGASRMDGGRFVLGAHPRPAFRNAETRLLRSLVTTSSSRDSRVLVSPVSMPLSGVQAPASAPSLVVPSGLVRVDLRNVTRPVTHHFQSEIDGHERTYTLRVEHNTTASHMVDQARHRQQAVALHAGSHPNNGGVVSINLVRNGDHSLIPYVTLNGITLISMLRMGLIGTHKLRAYHQFVALPLYQDMAPWNIVFVGQRLDYIDFDTKDHTYDKFVPKAYETMEVLFNYKRTVEDFGRCGMKGRNPYGFPFVSDCVGSDYQGPCKDSSKPVPCGDGTCRSDYVACLRAMSVKELADKAERRRRKDDAKQWKHLADTTEWGKPFSGADVGGDAGGAPQAKAVVGGGGGGPPPLGSEWSFDNGGVTK